MQKWSRIYDYIHEYQQLVYDYYSKDAVAYLCTYYNIDANNTIWDDDNLFGGSYEKIGELSGIRWNKILLLPVFFIEETSTQWEGTEHGLHKDNETSIVIPSTYNITPYTNDIIKFEQEYLRTGGDTYPIFSVKGREASTNADRRFWKLKVSIEQSRTVDEVDKNVFNSYTFFDYDKNIHKIDDASFLTKLLAKNETLKENLNLKFDDNSGFYLL